MSRLIGISAFFPMCIIALSFFFLRKLTHARVHRTRLCCRGDTGDFVDLASDAGGELDRGDTRLSLMAEELSVGAALRGERSLSLRVRSIAWLSLGFPCDVWWLYEYIIVNTKKGLVTYPTAYLTNFRYSCIYGVNSFWNMYLLTEGHCVLILNYMIIT